MPLHSGFEFLAHQLADNLRLGTAGGGGLGAETQSFEWKLTAEPI
jgi:hypothetical protein